MRSRFWASSGMVGQGWALYHKEPADKLEHRTMAEIDERPRRRMGLFGLILSLEV